MKSGVLPVAPGKRNRFGTGTNNFEDSAKNILASEGAAP